ncbi:MULTISPECIES: nucleoside hydrolase [Brenneria]|uniref:Nucleoside hydrolase n=1 Tax=Brenneria nigrifluens DSM 30175 = ATCC 13028 TaxID=1121120 RepID=A0A2U1ULU1_9GAMM|nr:MULTISPECIES: nucleoside hydrolase [Brenneria]EHD19481.1 Inosine/uridine-preferring nucleoside hydrolase [Brenneria sp. EniD312]PWC22636.1 nucleoside hydrolase [Brenneria nigrifluens] [Brenneria nigrifluens DSM 30175 = ATCC 13028]QCR02757.1 nucleoside hydrolase [Brenneria nigrifluens] [Brenneria nigrifluens DSM 30175 = ATCC 13028]
MARKRIIIDTDPGVDDAIAIWLALAAPELDVLGITAVAGNVPLADTLVNACKVVGLTGRSDVPVYAGAPGPLVREQVYGKYAHIGAFSDDLVPQTTLPPQREHAVDFLVRAARQAAAQNNPITICALGPMTNLALALRHHPDVARGVKQIVSMSGAFSALGNRVPWADFNVYADPHAAEIVFSSGVPVVIMPLDMTFQALIQRHQVDDLARRGGAPGVALAALLGRFDRNEVARFGREGGPIHDATVVAWLLKPQLFSGVSTTVGVEVSGRTAGYVFADFYHKLGQPANALVMRDIDEQGFLSLLADYLSRYGSEDS